ncbi:MAG: hypothetical protein EOO27_34945 [Comamonadaceae bacterium]|nr:MAG: hypothetical protein EOO27_34945 [Comamonadaceae bacterium]
MYTENKGIPLGVIWQSIADTIKSNDFTQRLDQTRQGSAARMTDALVNALNAQGFDARVLQGVPRSPKDPNYIDPKKLPTTDPVFHVQFNEVGMYSSRFSMDYVPRMNVYAELIDSANNDFGYSDYVYYGADARGAAPWSIPSDPAFKWSSFNAMVERPQGVTDAYNAAVDAIAVRLAANLREEVKARSLAAQ